MFDSSCRDADQVSPSFLSIDSRCYLFELQVAPLTGVTSMPRIKLTKSTIDALPTPNSDVVYWDAALPGFGIKVTPQGRKVFIVLYRTGGAGSRLRKYTIGPFGRVTLHQARIVAQKVFAAKLEGRDPASEKREPKRRVAADQVEDLLETFMFQRLSPIEPWRRFGDYSGGRSASPGLAGAFMKLANETQSTSSTPSNSGVLRPQPTKL